MINKPLYVTIDSNIFDACKYDFSKDGTLGLLVRYVEQGKIKIVLSDIVIREIEKHIVDKAGEVYGEIRNTKKKILKGAAESYIKRLGLINLFEPLDIEGYINDSKAAWREFVESLNAEILDYKKVEIDKIINDYFDCNPPFENNEKKKYEFPDALIANQIKNRFAESEAIAVVSNDSGIKRALESKNNITIFDRLGELFNYITKQEQEYCACYFLIRERNKKLIEEINNMLLDDTNIEVNGLSYDRKGMSEGYDYYEFMVNYVDTLITDIATIDEITEDTVRTTLVCRSNIGVECFYEDYDNAIWDSETKSYGYLETLENYETHKVEYEICAEINRIDENITILPFLLKLDEDTRKDIQEIDRYNYEEQWEDERRAENGFCDLERYPDFLAGDLEKSEFCSKVIKEFNEINDNYKKIEEIAGVYDDLVEKIENKEIDNGKINEIIKMFAKENEIHLHAIDEVRIDEINTIIKMICKKSDEFYSFSEEKELPDFIEYGSDVEISCLDKKYILHLAEYVGLAHKGEENTIDIYLLDVDNNIVVRGEVRFTVGYLNINDDGEISEGLEDSVEYDCDAIIEFLGEINALISSLVNAERKITKKLDDILRN